MVNAGFFEPPVLAGPTAWLARALSRDAARRRRRNTATSLPRCRRQELSCARHLRTSWRARWLLWARVGRDLDRWPIVFRDKRLALGQARRQRVRAGDRIAPHKSKEAASAASPLFQERQLRVSDRPSRHRGYGPDRCSCRRCRCRLLRPVPPHWHPGCRRRSRHAAKA